jgi:hypothetical protein
MPTSPPVNYSCSPPASDFYQFIENAWRRCLSFNYDGLPEIPAIQGGFDQSHADFP